MCFKRSCTGNFFKISIFLKTFRNNFTYIDVQNRLHTSVTCQHNRWVQAVYLISLRPENQTKWRSLESTDYNFENMYTYFVVSGHHVL